METTRFEKFSWIVATVFGAGYLPERLGLAPGKGAGTVASLITLIVIQIPMVLLEASVYMAIGAAMVSFIIGLVIVGPADSYIRKTEGEQTRHDGVKTDHDFNQNCWDEVVGMLVAGIPVFWLSDMTAAWPRHDHFSFSAMLVLLLDAFIVFRVFDMTKWLGIRWIEKVLGKNALGILWDDVAAAIYAWFAIGVTLGLKYGFDAAFCGLILIASAVMWIGVFFVGLVLAGELADIDDMKGRR